MGINLIRTFTSCAFFFLLFFAFVLVFALLLFLACTPDTCCPGSWTCITLQRETSK
jgi:hypothetical protein